MNSNFYTFQKYKNLDKKNNKLSPSMEDYLEMIYRIYIDNSEIRINTISQKLNVKMSSASKIVQRLANKGYVVYIKYGNIHLTDLGEVTGKYLYIRHNIIDRFLSLLMQGEHTIKDTEILEHCVSKEILDKIVKLNNFFTANPDILNRFYKYKNH